MRLLVTGSRHWTDREKIRRWLTTLESTCSDDEKRELCHGAAPGADTIAAEEAFKLGFMVVPFPAKWAEYGNKAGPLRNEEMLAEFKPTFCLAFPRDDSKGTWDMVRRVQAAGVSYAVIWG